MGLLSVIPIQYRIIAYLVVALALIAFGWVKGNDHGSQKLFDYQAAEAKEAVRIVTARGAVTERVVTEYIKVEGKTKTVTETVAKEVVRYETLKLDRAMLSVAAVGLHDSAAANTVPDTARAVDGSASGVETAALLATCTANYGTYHQVADELRGLQDWLKKQAAVR